MDDIARQIEQHPTLVLRPKQIPWSKMPPLTLSAIPTLDLAHIPVLDNAHMPALEAISAPSFQNSWSSFGSTYQSAGYYRDAFGVVHLVGAIKRATAPSDLQVIFQLPTGYRPLADSIWSLLTGDSNALPFSQNAGIVIRSSGNVVWREIGADYLYVSLEGISFRTS